MVDVNTVQDYHPENFYELNLESSQLPSKQSNAEDFYSPYPFKRKPQQYYNNYKVMTETTPGTNYPMPNENSTNPYEDRYNSLPASNKPEYVYWSGWNGPLFSINDHHQKGTVSELFFSYENIRRLGDYLEDRGLGRPSPDNIRELQQLIIADEPDFLYTWRRDERAVHNQLIRLNSLLLQELIPKLEMARESWLKYQYDSYFGWGWQLIDRPEDVSCKRQNTSLEFNNRLY